MDDIFLKIVNMSISASWIVLVVLLLRFLLKKAPKWINGILWGIVGLRLIMPFSLESIFSLMPSNETISKDPDVPRPYFESGVTVIDNRVNDYLGGHYYEGVTKPTGYFADFTTVLAIVWIVGIIVLLCYTIISYLKVKNKVDTAVLLRDNIYQSENVVSPFVLGFVKPKIYLPFNMTESNINHVIAHENAHIRRKDHWWKPFGFLLLAIHWFNPLMWLGYVLLCRDIELACDEKVIKELNTEQKADYSQALLTCSVNRRMIAACPLAFGEVGVKNRVKSVLNYKKPAFWIIAIAIVASIVVAVCFLTNPKQDAELGISSQKSGSDLNGVSLEIVEADLSAPDPYIIVEWKNDTDNKLSFGEQFAIYYNQGGSWENCSIEENPIWHLPAYMFDANSSVEHTYKLNGQIMTQSGKYRFEAPFTIDGKNETKYNAWIEFELAEGVEGITVHTFKPIELVYDDGMYSFVQTVENAPIYMIVNGMQLVVKTYDTVSDPIGTFEEITLNKDNFDLRFRGPTDYSWLADDTLKSLKENNKRIWQIYGDSSAETPHLYILLEQKDGTYYLGFGYYNCNSNNPTNPDDSHIRWLYKLEEISESNVGGADGPVNMVVTVDMDQLKSKFPNYFGLTTSKGLEVYIWQMAEGSYSCGLLPGKNLNYTQEELWNLHKSSASLDEMRAIIADYMVNGDVPKSNIFIQAIGMPHSSYAYTIDDEYRRKLNELFWSEIPIVENTKYSPIIDTAIFDIDGDGKNEQCSLSYGPTSGLFTFILSVSENGKLEYYNIYNGLAGEMSFETTTGGTKLHLVPQGESKPIDYSFRVKEGNIVLTANGENVAYWGEQGLNSPYAPKTASDLNAAIAEVLNEKYRAEKPDGLVHIENYYLLANETASGTPLKGNSGHMTKATVYLLVYHMKYSVSGDHLEEVEGDFVPTAITFTVDENGKYTVNDYWTPQTGSNYEKDVRSKFPGSSATEALNTEKYAEDLIKENWRLAEEYMNKINRTS